jgi:hypothetical protein
VEEWEGEGERQWVGERWPATITDEGRVVLERHHAQYHFLQLQLTTYFIYAVKQQRFAEGFLSLSRFRDKVLKISEQFWIVTVGTALARQKHGLITAQYDLATVRSVVRASRRT